MISSITSGMSMPAMPPKKNDQVLSETQLSFVTETLSNYDSDNLSEADAISIVNAFTAEGISPGSSLESAMSELGFNAKDIGDTARSSNGGMPPPPPKESSFDSTEIVSFLDELLEQLGDKLQDSDKEGLLAAIKEKFDLDNDDSIISLKV